MIGINKLLKIGDEIEVELMNIIAEFGEPILLRVSCVNLGLVFDLPIDYGSIIYWVGRRDSGTILKLVLIDFGRPNKVTWKVSEVPNSNV